MQTGGEWRSAGVTLPDSFKATDKDRRKKNRRREGRKVEKKEYHLVLPLFF